MGLVEKLRDEMVNEYEGRCSLFSLGVGEEGVVLDSVAGRHLRGKFHGGLVLVDVAVQTEALALALGGGVPSLSQVPPVGFVPLAPSCGEKQQQRLTPHQVLLSSLQMEDITRISTGSSSIDSQSGRLEVLLYSLPSGEPRPPETPSDTRT